MLKQQKRESGRWQVLRFGSVGVLNTAVDFTILNLLLLFFGMTSGPGLVACNVAAFTGASLNSYICNRRWTFGERTGASVGQCVLFLVFSIGGLVVNTLVVLLLSSIASLGGILAPVLQINLAKVCATLVSMAWNYLTYRHIVFRGALERQQTA